MMVSRRILLQLAEMHGNRLLTVAKNSNISSFLAAMKTQKSIIGYLLLLQLASFQLRRAESLMCSDILQAGSGKVFNQKELGTLNQVEEMSDDCLATLGKSQLDIGQAQTLWTIIVQVCMQESTLQFTVAKILQEPHFMAKIIRQHRGSNIFGSPNEIPEEKLRLVGWIAAGIPINDFYNLSLSDVDTIAAFGQFRNLSQNQLLALKDSIFNQWSGKDIRDLTNYDLIMFRNIICAFNATEISLIRPESYKNAASEIGTLKQECPPEVTTSLAKLATNPSAFGHPSKWTSTQLAAIGCVIAGLPSIENIPAKAMEGISIEIINCLSPRILEAMSVDQLSHFPPASAGSLSSIQSSALSYQQKKALDNLVIDLTYQPSLGKAMPNRNIESYLVFSLLAYHLYMVY